jgi:hypothetical protein
VVLYGVLTISGESRVFLITLVLQACIHKDDLVFILIRFIDNILFSILDLIPGGSQGNILDHISAKNKLASYCLQCCVMGASNKLITMQLIKVKNQM